MADIANDIKKYFAEVENAAKENTPYYCYNEDREHNAAILSAMFSTSNRIRMYCGSMSVFRNSFWDKIKDSSAIVQIFEKKLNEFASEANNSFEIVVEKYPEDGFRDFKFKDILSNMLETKILKLYKLGDSITFKEEIPYFTFASACFVRVEQDKESHSALCAINNEELMNSSEIFYSKLKEFANPVSEL